MIDLLNKIGVLSIWSEANGPRSNHGRMNRGQNQFARIFLLFPRTAIGMVLIAYMIIVLKSRFTPLKNASESVQQP
jgi:hypothetical protein